MALIETRQLPEGRKFESVTQVIRALRGAVADECSAQNLYSEIIDILKATDKKGYAKIIERIEEIMHDEENHAGSLFFVIGQLDKSIAENMEAGAAGS